MKIAVACAGDQIFGHFGHCENFMLFDAENGAITAENSVPNPGHKPGFLPNYLADLGVNVIIAGGMGGGMMGGGMMGGGGMPSGCGGMPGGGMGGR